jgi:hypothetical protein
MTQRTKVVNLLTDYFETKGGVMTLREYDKQGDAPIRSMRVRQIFGSWNRMENIVRKADSRNSKPENFVPLTDIDEVIAERNAKLLAEYELIGAGSKAEEAPEEEAPEEVVVNEEKTPKPTTSANKTAKSS